jgi:hypothetical protein
VKVNVLEIYRPPGGPLAGRYISAGDVEERLKAWLKDNPSAQIEHVVQTPVARNEGWTEYLLVTIFYRSPSIVVAPYLSFSTVPIRRGVSGVCARF